MNDLDELIPEEDARRMVRLLADVVAAPGGHEEKKRALMGGLCDLVDADFWIWGLAVDFTPGEPPKYTSMMTGGFAEEQVPKLFVALDNEELIEMMEPSGRLFDGGRVDFTQVRKQYDPGDVFLRPSIAREWKEADISPPLVYYRQVQNNSLSGIGVYRRFGEPDFSHREAKIAHIIMSEVGWLHEQGWPWEPVLQVPHLSNRCRMALNLLLEGLPRKQIADTMGISIHTANEYIKKVYEIYGVHSHAELVNRFRIGDGGYLLEGE